MYFLKLKNISVTVKNVLAIQKLIFVKKDLDAG